MKSKQPPVEVDAAVGAWHGSTAPLPPPFLLPNSANRPQSLHIPTRPSPWHSRDTDRGKRREPPRLRYAMRGPPRGYTPDLPLNTIPPSYNRFNFLRKEKATSNNQAGGFTNP